MRAQKGTNKKERHWLVRWSGYGPNYDTWEPDDHIRYAQEELDKYKAANPLWSVTERKKLRGCPRKNLIPSFLDN